MTPAARIATAIAILDTWIEGVPVEKALTNWARQARYAGSSDRAAIRDLVFSALRCKASYAWLGGQDTGRGLMLGHVRKEGLELEALFNGSPHAPAVLTRAEQQTRHLEEAPLSQRVDCLDWLWPKMQASLGETAEAVLSHLQARAPIFLRVNTRRADPDKVRARLLETGIETSPHPLAPNALEITENHRRCLLYTSDAADD